MAKGAMSRLMAEHPEDLLAALKIVNSNLIQYSLASIERGASGIFLSVPATAETLKAEEYEKFMRPFDVDLLKFLQGKGECHILHAHGEKLYLDRMLDYHVQVLSWADLNGGPTIAQARQKTSLTLMAGIDHVNFPNMSIKKVKDQVRAALAQAGDTRFILAPGCAIPTYSFTPLIKAIRGRFRINLPDFRATSLLKTADLSRERAESYSLPIQTGCLLPHPGFLRPPATIERQALRPKSKKGRLPPLFALFNPPAEPLNFKENPAIHHLL